MNEQATKNVCNQIFYCIHTPNYISGDIWKVGNSFIVDETTRNYLNKGILESRIFSKSDKLKNFGFLEYNKLKLKEYEPNNILPEFFNLEGVEQENILYEIYNLFYECNNLFELSLKSLREHIFENVRIKKFPNLPSRFNCIWLTRKENLQVWNNVLNSDASKKVFKVKVSGQISEADGSFLDLDIMLLNDFYTNADRYWSSTRERIEKHDEPEILFLGSVDVIDQYDSLSEIV